MLVTIVHGQERLKRESWQSSGRARQTKCSLYLERYLVNVVRGEQNRLIPHKHGRGLRAHGGKEHQGHVNEPSERFAPNSVATTHDARFCFQEPTSMSLKALRIP